jgi:hypothetical protein
MTIENEEHKSLATLKSFIKSKSTKGKKFRKQVNVNVYQEGMKKFLQRYHP